MRKFFSGLLTLFFLSSCHLLFNYQPDIDVRFDGKKVHYSLDLPEKNEIKIVIKAQDYDGVIDTVHLAVDGERIDISGLDRNEAPESFHCEYTLNVPPGAVENIRIVVNDNMDGMSVKQFQIDRLASLPGDPDNPVEVIVPEIKTDGGGLLSEPEPRGKVYYYNQYHIKSESDIQIDEPFFGEMYAKRYLKVTGVAEPDDSGYKDRGYHSVLFSALHENSGEKYYFTFPVNRNNRFRGYLYFPKPGTYSVMAYRAWNNYLYPKKNSRSTAVGVDEGYATCYFKVKVKQGHQVPSGSVHLIPSRNVDSGTKYLREYAQSLTEGIDNNMDKVKTIYEFLVFGDSEGAFNYKYYDEIYPGYLESCWSDVFIASHFLGNRVGVCNDYSELFAALTRSLGFKVKKIWGYVPGSTGHQWNSIEIDGRWYRLDPTWASGSVYYREYAEFYDEFRAEYFHRSHEERYYSGFTKEY